MVKGGKLALLRAGLKLTQMLLPYASTVAPAEPGLMPAPPITWNAPEVRVVVQLSTNDVELRNRLKVKRAESPSTI